MHNPPPVRIAVLTAALVLALAVLVPAPAGAASRSLESSLEGIVSVSVADFVSPDKNGNLTGHSQTFYTVRVGEFEFVDLEGDPDMLATLQTGELVVLEGQHENPQLFRAIRVISRVPGPYMGFDKAVVGEQDLAVIPMQFLNVPFTQTCPLSLIDGISFTGPQSLTAYWEEASFGNLTFSPQSHTFDVITLDENYAAGAPCGSTQLRAWAGQADTAIGAEISGYNRRIYVLPRSMANYCPFGLGDVGFSGGGGLTLSWVTGCNSPDAYIHEFGHNISLLHANRPGQEYGDLGDIMGFGNVGVRKLNAPHVDHLDWLPSGEPHFGTLSGVGVYGEVLTALGRDYLVEPNQTQVLKIFSPALNTDLYVSYRDDHGMDADLRSDYQFMTHIHTTVNGGTGSTLLRRLDTGDSYVVAPDGITITQMGTDQSAGTATVRVVIETPNDCEEGLPQATIIDTQPSHSTPGGTINYTLEIANTDDEGCLPLELSIAASLPTGDGWSADQPVELGIPAGQAMPTVFSVTSPPDITGFNYNFSIIVSAPADAVNEHQILIPAIYKVDRLAPTAPEDLVMTAATPDSVTMAWTPSTDFQSGVSHYEILRSPGDENFAVIGQSPTPDYVDETAGEGDFCWYLLRAVDAAGNVSE